MFSNRPIEGLVSTDRSMVAALLNTTPRPVTKSSANDSTPRPWTCIVSISAIVEHD